MQLVNFANVFVKQSKQNTTEEDDNQFNFLFTVLSDVTLPVIR
jgi:hypothetical protein